MALKFLYLTQDPFTNNSEEFVRILGTSIISASFNGTGGALNGILQDPSGNEVMYMFTLDQTLGTSSTAYPYISESFSQASQVLIIPPGWTFRGFGRAIAVQGTLEEVLRVH
jgi:hypothetical protein